MKHEKLAQALNEISDRHLLEAAARSKRRYAPWAGALAAVLVLCIVAAPLLQKPSIVTDDPTSTAPSPPPFDSQTVSYQFLTAAPTYPELCAYPKEDSDALNYTRWLEDQKQLHSQPEGYADNLQGYFASMLPVLMQASTETNTVCSPLNIYMALAMLAEITDGESRQQILQLLHTDSMQALRTQAQQIWQAHYNDDGLSKSILGSSLWLEEGIPCNEDTLRVLAEYYYASVFQGDLGSDAVNKELQTWINAQTDGLLQEQAGNIPLSEESVLALATTICYQVQWRDSFYEGNNTTAVFHTNTGDREVTYMNKELSFGPYYWGDRFSAVHLSLEDNSRMWLILPDEGFAPEDILEDVAAFLSHNPASYDSDYSNKKNVRVNLSVPKFDVSAQLELSDTLKSLGLTDIFDRTAADFSSIYPEITGGCVDRVTHAARVKIDEEGISAAAFTVIGYAGSAAPKDEVVDFVLDRPFLFYVESADALPLFTGIVNEP